MNPLLTSSERRFIMSFELLDNILLESGNDPVYKKEVVKEEEVIKEEEIIKEDKVTETTDDSEIFEDLDNLIESAMRSTLKYTIMESSIADDVKLNHLMIVEDAEFTKEQMDTFMTETIHPILEVAGFIDDTYDFGGDDPTPVSLPVYEVALTLSLANDGELEAMSLTESVLGEVTDEDIINEHLEEIYKGYGIEDEERDEVLEAAIEALEEIGVNNLIPSLDEITNIVMDYNMLAEINGEPLFHEILESDKLLEKKKPGFAMTAEEKIKAKKSRLKALGIKVKKGIEKTRAATKTVAKGAKTAAETTKKGAKTAFGKVKAAPGAAKAKWSKMGKLGKRGAVAGAITATALATAATLAWRKKKSQCSGLEGDAASKCNKAAAQDAIRTLQGQMKNCKDAKNPERCMAAANKQMDKWKTKMAK